MSDVHPTKRGSIRESARHVAEHASALAKLELELAGLEVKKKATSIGIGVGLAVGAALFAFFMLAFLFATLAAVLATFMDTWLALLVVTLFLGLLATTLALIGRNRIQKGSPPIPEQAIREAQLTGEALTK